MSQQISWKRVLVEGVVIVGSILLAFAIDAGWDGRQESLREERRLEALTSEFRQTREELRGQLEGVQSALAGTREVLALMGGSDASVTPAELFESVIASFDVGVFTARNPVLTVMLTSGELLELEGGALLVRLSHWQRELDHLRLDSQHLEDGREETIFGRAVELGVVFGSEHAGSSLLAILDDPGMRSAFSLRALRAERLADSYRLALQRVEEILAMLEVDA